MGAYKNLWLIRPYFNSSLTILVTELSNPEKTNNPNEQDEIQ